ncbi:MAG: hypothetical protein U5L01_04525 [Rheinheimera sp.]|nr:hypothetical protein [Rheinheimera sp.]
MSKRRQLYFLAQDYAAEQVPLHFQSPILDASQVKSSKVTGMQINPYGGISFTAAGKTR